MASIMTMDPRGESIRFADYNFTVHEYYDSTAPLPTSQETAMNRGLQILKAISSAGVPAKVRTRIGVDRSMVFNNSFILRENPPVMVFQENDMPQTKEWGAPVTNDEIYHLDDLEEFQGTDLAHLLIDRHIMTRLLNVENESKRREKEDLVTDQPPKRTKLNHDVLSLYRLIPQPHVHPSPFPAFEKPLKGKPFNKNQPIFISPNASMSLAHGARVAWLIPIRGALPWEGCTSGTLLDLESEPQPSMSDSPTKDSIPWTEAFLLEFWAFLLNLRNSNSMGPLAISFNASKRIQPTPVSLGAPSTLDHRPGGTETMAHSRSPQSSLSTVDYIKIFHDAPRRFYLRSALDIWSCHHPGGSAKKVRLLKDARFVLVDEVSQGILIS